MNKVDALINRSALGRVGFLGELYDIRTENFTSRSIFSAALPSSDIKNIDINNTLIDYKVTENISDRFELLDVEADLQVYLLCGLFETEGCGKFLNSEKNSSKNISCSLVSKYQTVCEKIFVPFAEIINLIDMTALDDPQYTHVVTEISWGANCLLNIELICSSESRKKEIDGLVNGEIKKLAGIFAFAGKGNVTFEEGSFWKQNNTRIQVMADVTPENEIPTSLESFYRFLSEVPSLLKRVNNGKGKPINYAMIPLSTIRKLTRVESAFENVVNLIDESFLISIICLFEEITTIKQKIQELNREISEYENYLSQKVVTEARLQMEMLKVKESRLKSLVAESWILVKSNRKNLRDLIKSVEKFKSTELKLHEFENYISSLHPVLNKICTIKNYKNHGIEYLGKNKLLSNELKENTAQDFIVFVTSAKFQSEDPLLFQNTSYFFLTLADDRNDSTKYVVVDLDLDETKSENETNSHFFLNRRVTKAKCMHFKKGNLINDDLYAFYIAEQTTCYARLEKSSEADYFHQKPGSRVILKLKCPGFYLGHCSSDELEWKCFRCKKNLEYGFDKFFYCACGRGGMNSYEYRCSNYSHGTSFLPYESRFLCDELATLRPLNEMNILIMGQSGVGKSTWINSIVNYLTYDSFEEASQNGVICTIPLTFVTYDPKTAERHEINIGEETKSEVTEAGQSGTQFCSTYSFFWEDKYVRLIDTPGVGDTRGVAQDKENMKNIIQHISYLKELHGICILMKANDCRINAIFSYCLKELLIHMHKSIANNIVFCFTNARNSFYTPGQTSVLLEKQLESLNLQTKLSLGLQNRFCLDNEAFLFLCTLQYSNIRHSSHLVESFGQSWEISLKETRRLFSTIATFKSHSLHNTMSLYSARNKILSLSRPIAEISKTIQMNMATISKRKHELHRSEETLSQLSKKLYIDEIHLEPVALARPRTVCTSSKCVEYHRIESYDITEIEYKMHCHKECYLKNVELKAVNNAALKFCKAMRSGTCTNCGCDWRTHMHILFEQKRVTKKGINKRIESDMKKEKSDKQKLKEFLQMLERKLQKYKEEQEFVIQVSVKFGMFLKENAISVYNDAVADYLKYLIDLEENKPYKTESDEKLLKNLKDTLNHYETEAKILQDVVSRSGEQGAVPSIEEIYQLEQKLYDLELMGEDIKKNVEASRISFSAAASYAETPLSIPKSKLLKKKLAPKAREKKFIFF